MAKIIGIDFGTAHSVVSVWDDKLQVPIVIPNLRGNLTTPSIVSINMAAEVIVGEDALKNLLYTPEPTECVILSELGSDSEVILGGRVYSPQATAAFVLRYLRQCAEGFLGETVRDAVVAVPAYFTERQRHAIVEAGNISGLEVHSLIDSPTASAIAYGVSRVGRGEQRVYAVYDLGGRTFDISIIMLTPESTAVVALGGDMHLGGLDMDERVSKWALHEIRKSHGVDLRADELARRRLRAEAGDARKALVVAENAALNVPHLCVVHGKPLSLGLSLSRKRFDMLVRPPIGRSLRIMEETMARARERWAVEWDDLDGVLLVGGPTRIHKVRDMLREKVVEHRLADGCEIRTDVNPEVVVSMGAAIMASQLQEFELAVLDPGTNQQRHGRQSEHCMPHRVFVSYSRQDKATADAVCAILERNRIRCWIAPRDIPAGQTWAGAIVHAIRECRIFVLVFSANANVSDHVMREVGLAFGNEIPVIPFRVEDVQPSDELDYYLSSIHWLDALTPPLERHIEKLVRQVDALLEASNDSPKGEDR